MAFLSLGSVAHLLAVLGLIVLLLLLLAVAVLATPVEARVDDETVVARGREVVEAPLVRLLASLPAARVDVVAPGRITVRTSRTPPWAVLIAILAFPVGLIVLPFARRRLELYVRFLDEPGGGTRLLVTGRTRRRIARALGEAVGSLEPTASAGAR